MVKRQRVVVYFQDETILEDLKRKDIYYTSTKDKYCIIYFNAHEQKKILQELESNNKVSDYFLANERVENYNF